MHSLEEVGFSFRAKAVPVVLVEGAGSKHMNLIFNYGIKEG